MPNNFLSDDTSGPRVPTQARLDITQLAACARFFSAQGEKPKSRSHLLHMITSSFFYSMVRAGLMDPVATPADAAFLLEEMGITWSDTKAGNKALMKILQEDDGLFDSLKRLSKDDERNKQDKPQLTPEQQALMAQLQNLPPVKK